MPAQQRLDADDLATVERDLRLIMKFELAEFQQDIATLDALRPRLQRLRALTDRADDTELALGSDILSASLDGYALTKVFGKGTSLDTLKEAMKTRLSRKPRKPASPEA